MGISVRHEYGRLKNFVIGYNQLTEEVARLSGLSDKFLHMQAGLVLWLLAALILRQHLAARGPVIVIVVLEAANEVANRLYHGDWRWRDTIADAAATWAWPIIIAATLILVPKLRPPQRADSRAIDHFGHRTQAAQCNPG